MMLSRNGFKVSRELAGKDKQKFSKICVELKKIWWVIRYKFGEGNGTPLQYSCLENPMSAGAWKPAVHGVAEDQARRNEFTFTHWRRK